MADPKINIKYFSLVNNVIQDVLPILENNQDTFNLTLNKIESFNPHRKILSKGKTNQ